MVPLRTSLVEKEEALTKDVGVIACSGKGWIVEFFGEDVGHELRSRPIDAVTGLKESRPRKGEEEELVKVRSGHYPFVEVGIPLDCQ